MSANYLELRTLRLVRDAAWTPREWVRRDPLDPLAPCAVATTGRPYYDPNSHVVQRKKPIKMPGILEQTGEK